MVKDANGTHYDDVNMNEINGIKTGGYTKRKRPVYEDCRLLSPDGQLLCRINKKKLDWYVNRGLGSIEFYQLIINIAVVSDSPYTVMLRFEPKCGCKVEK